MIGVPVLLSTPSWCGEHDILPEIPMRLTTSAFAHTPGNWANLYRWNKRHWWYLSSIDVHDPETDGHERQCEKLYGHGHVMSHHVASNVNIAQDLIDMIYQQCCRFHTASEHQRNCLKAHHSFGLISSLVPIPIGSMYAIYGHIYHRYTPNVSIYTIHGPYGIY